MPVVIPPLFAVIGIQLRHSADPAPWFVTWGANCQDANDDVIAIGEKACAAFMSWSTWISDEVVVEGAQVTYGAVLDQDPIRQFVPNAGASEGDSTVGMLPQNCALLVRKNTGLGGRKNRGRFFLPGMVSEEGVNNVGIIDTADRTAYQGGADAFLAALGTGDLILPMVILHNDYGDDTPDPTPVTSLTVDSTISTQRRRLR
jgi:hypothetical protein